MTWHKEHESGRSPHIRSFFLIGHKLCFLLQGGSVAFDWGEEGDLQYKTFISRTFETSFQENERQGRRGKKKPRPGFIIFYITSPLSS